MAEDAVVRIERLGARGDGLATVDGVTHYVPFALPGEDWGRTTDGTWTRLGERVARPTPVCRHFEACGGCAAQHMPTELYIDWKMSLVRQAFAHRNIEPEVRPLLMVPEAARRRCVLTARRRGAGIVLGYHGARSHELIDLEECPILREAIVAALPGVRDLTQQLLPSKGEARITVLETETGLDMSIDGDLQDMTPELRATTADRALEMNLARLNVGDEEIIQSRTPVLTFGGSALAVPPRAFVQAVRVAEDWMADLVCKSVKGSKSIADLFCGVGTFALALAHGGRVLAIDSDRTAIAALERARDRGQGLKPIVAKVRDLFREPLSRKELSTLDAVVFDPPRAGAEAQARTLAASQVPKIVAVSCHPATLARDARILIDGGYELRWVQPVDQFLYSAHVECVALFSKAAVRQRRRR